jgi:hypothetical protein
MGWKANVVGATFLSAEGLAKVECRDDHDSPDGKPRGVKPLLQQAAGTFSYLFFIHAACAAARDSGVQGWALKATR